jgi:acetyl-CoA C-acetyltransferase
VDYQVKPNPLKPYSRSVSIIGVGATPFMFTKDDPETDGLCDGEMFGHAAIEAMKDAGVTAKDVDFFVHGQAGPGWQTVAGTPAMHVANWFGMKGKGSCHHSEACCTGYVALEQAVSYVASGAYDVVLTGCCDMSYSPSHADKPAFMRRYCTDDMFHDILLQILAKDYTLESNAALTVGAEGWLGRYVTENGLSDDQIDDVLCALAISQRRASALHPLGLSRETYDELAQAMGMKDAGAFIRSKFNPRITRYMRVSAFEQRCDGAAALVVCPTEIAHRYDERPVEVLGIGHSCLEAGTARLEKQATEAAYAQVSELTGLTGDDMDLFLANDFWMQSQFLAAEACDYIPKGEAWKYILEDRTAFDGDRPVNSNGGRCQFGHAHGSSGVMDTYEAVKQMRGEMGPTQVKKPVKHAMLRGFGGGQNVACTILKYNG